MKYLILFDIDGTILRMKRGMANKLFSELMNSIFELEVPDEAMPSFAGMTDLKILRIISENINYPYEKMLEKLTEVQDKMRIFFEEICDKDHIDILPGIEELIKKLHDNKDVTLGLLTGNFKANAYLKLKAHNLEEYFNTGAFGDDAEDRNLLPEVAISRANKLEGKENFDNRNTLIIGDTLNDIFCAQRNDIPVIAVATGPIPVEELSTAKPDKVFENFSDSDKVVSAIMEIMNNKYLQ